jgi:hypothetical protein
MFGDASSSESETSVLVPRTGVLGLRRDRSPLLLLSIEVVRRELDCGLNDFLVVFSAPDPGTHRGKSTEVWLVTLMAEDWFVCR